MDHSHTHKFALVASDGVKYTFPCASQAIHFIRSNKSIRLVCVRITSSIDYADIESGIAAILQATNNNISTEYYSSSNCSWSDHLAFDFNVSNSYPVIKGTWVTTDQIVTLIIDGWTWSDIIKTNPGLTAADIRAAISYTITESDAVEYGVAQYSTDPEDIPANVVDVQTD